MLGNNIYYLLHPFKKYIIINTWAHIKHGVLQHDNFGDELNVYLVEKLTGKKVKFHNSYFHFPQRNYLVIGSLIEGFTDKRTIIWGSGAIIGGDKPLKNRPLKVSAVRGKKSREYLLMHGVECPEVYGDPALLMPTIYNPQLPLKWEVGIIPHINDLNNPLIKQMEGEKGVHIIKFKNYSDWHDVIDEIKKCRIILSSSLHGLILSDAYGIPNLWISVSNNIIGGDFKFLDYFSGVERHTNKPIKVEHNTRIEDLIEQTIKQYKPIVFNKDILLDACPFM